MVLLSLLVEVLDGFSRLRLLRIWNKLYVLFDLDNMF